MKQNGYKLVILALMASVSAAFAPVAGAYDLSLAARETGLTPNLIRAIALEESRRVDPADRQIRPWPWTLGTPDQAMFFESRQEAIASLRELLEQGKTNIDIGALQVNVRWNGDLAASPEDLLDPGINLWAFTQVIRECQHRLGTDLPVVLACYHTGQGNSARGNQYASRVLATYQSLKNGVK